MSYKGVKEGVIFMYFLQMDRAELYTHNKIPFPNAIHPMKNSQIRLQYTNLNTCSHVENTGSAIISNILWLIFLEPVLALQDFSTPKNFL